MLIYTNVLKINIAAVIHCCEIFYEKEHRRSSKEE